MSRRRSALLGAAAAVLATGAASSAMAGGFALREQSTVGQGMSFAGMAAGGGDSISGMFWNPAVVNQVDHYQGEQHVTGVFASSKIKVDGSTKDALDLISGGNAATGNSGNIGQGAVLSSGYNAYRINESVTVGLSIGAPYGLVTDPKQAWAGQTLSRSSKVFSVNATPTIGYQFNDWLAVGAGLQIQYFDISLRQAVGILPSSGTARLTGNDVGFGFTAGLTLKPLDGTEIGIGFRSSIKHNLDGKFRIEDAGAADRLDKIKANVRLPETVTVGLRQRVTEDLTLLGGFEWTNWSRLGVVNVRGTPAVSSLAFDYNDGYFASVGAEYAVNTDLKVRGGVGYEWSPINNKNRTTRLPDDDRWWLSAGASYNYSDKLGFDLGYSYVFVSGKSDINQTLPAPIPAPLNIFGATAKSDVHIVSAAVRYKFGGEAAPALVTKY